MAKSNKQINKEANAVMEPSENTPAVIAYRMGKLEDAVTNGFAAHDKKLDGLTGNFATKEELMVIQRQLDNYKWFLRALTVAVLTALAGAVAALITRGK